jgi:calcium channel MID1
MSSIGRERSGRGKDKGKKMLWPLVSLLLSLPLTRSQSTLSSLSLNTPLSLSGNNFSSPAPLLFSLPSSSQLTISIALCASPSSSPPRVFVSNSSDSQVPPGPSGGLDVFEITLNSLGLGNLTLDAGDTTGVLAVYGGTTSDSLEIGVSQGGKATNLPRPSPPTELILMTDSTHPRAPRTPALLRRLHCEPSCTLLPTLFPTPTHAPANIPELYPPAS